MVEMEMDQQGSRPQEMRLAYIIAFFAAVLSIINIGASKFRDREAVIRNVTITAYNEYYSKVLKQTLVQGERDLLEDMMRAGAIVSKDSMVILNRIASFDHDLALIGAQAEQLMNGTAANDTSRQEGSDPHVRSERERGIKQLEHEVEQLNLAGDNFDLAALLIELSLVLGAIGFLTRPQQGRNLFKMVMLFFGTLGMVFGLVAFYDAFRL